MKGIKYRFVEVSEYPDTIEDGVVYVNNGEESIKFCCPCGYSGVVVLSTLCGVRPRWEVVGKDTIKPSVNRKTGCGCHFTIVNGVTE